MKHGEQKSETQLSSYVLHSSRLRLDRFKLTVSQQSGEAGVQEYEFDDAPVRIGTLPDEVDIVLTDNTISRKHCEIVRVGDDYLIVDLNSTNGTFVRDVRVKQAFLEPGLEFRIGQVSVTFDQVESDVQITPTHKQQLGKVIGADVKMREIFSIIEKISSTDTTVIIEGETGTGKDVVAQSIHEHSRRKQSPFVVVDCSAIPEHLIESELFGHEKGSFTGAIMARKGLFEQAEGGTIFLDELGELSLELQPKLLRVLESREVRRVGGSKATPINVRVIAATNRKLEDEVREGRFREDLFYRLSVVRIFLPPLRERMGDLPLLLLHFLQKLPVNHPNDGAMKIKSISKLALGMMLSHGWPGNIRELLNTIERACTFADGDMIRVSDLPRSIQNYDSPLPDAEQADQQRVGLKELALFNPISPAPPQSVKPRLKHPLPHHVPEDTLTDKHLRQGSPSSSADAADDYFETFKVAKEKWITLFERDYILTALKRSNYNISHASREADIDRKYFRKLMQKYEIEIP